jgi:hypothetical protein
MQPLPVCKSGVANNLATLITTKATPFTNLGGAFFQRCADYALARKSLRDRLNPPVSVGRPAVDLFCLILVFSRQKIETRKERSSRLRCLCQFVTEAGPLAIVVSVQGLGIHGSLPPNHYGSNLIPSAGARQVRGPATIVEYQQFFLNSICSPI